MDAIIKKYAYLQQLTTLYFDNRDWMTNSQEVDQYQIIQDLKANLFYEFDLACCSAGLEYHEAHEGIADFLAEEGLLD